MIIQKKVKVGQRGQFVIPKEIRKREHITPGTQLEIIDIAGEIKIKVQKRQSKEPEDLLLEAVKGMKFTDSDWKTIKRERYQE
jgi:AbrB family looped-hinge helix DNA binding protein